MRLFSAAGTAPSEDLAFLLAPGITDGNPHDEPVELRFGKRVGTFQVNRVLCSDDQKRHIQWVGFSFDGNLTFLHSLKQGRLGFRGRAVDLISEEKLREDGAGAKIEPRLTLVIEKTAGDVAGKQVRRELNTL